MDDSITPFSVIQRVANAIPKELHGDIIIVGSLAASFHLLRDTGQVVRTKDIDGMVTPHARAVFGATMVTNRLLCDGWEPHAPDRYVLPGLETTSDDQLAVVRLRPPGKEPWFLELLGAPPAVTPARGSNGKTSLRLKTDGGHFSLPSFAFLGLVQFEPTLSEFDIRIATPEMMALANLLHHPAIGTALMSQNFGSRQIKRSNKDLGRVVALAYLSDLLDEDAVERWPLRWRQALGELAPEQADHLFEMAPSGMDALLASPKDMEEALLTVNLGLLSATPLSPAQFVIATRRLQQTLKQS